MPNLAAQPSRFTLVEMLVVVAIIAILAALLLPSLQKALHRARGAACMGGPVKAIGYMIGLYASDYNDWVPPTNSNGKSKKWYAAFWDAGYIKSGAEIWCPIVPFDKKRAKSLDDHIPFGSMATQVYDSVTNSSQASFYRFSRLKRPSKQMFAADSSYDLNYSWDVLVPRNTPNYYFVILPQKTGTGTWDRGRIDGRHANSAALVNFGGNAEMFMIHDRSAPWHTAPFGQPGSREFKQRCTNEKY